MECLIYVIKENKENFILETVIFSHISKKVKLLLFFDELFDLTSLGMFTEKPLMKPHALLLCSLGNVLA